MWRMCHNTPLSDGPYDYRLSLPTMSQWAKAADWGDVDHDGVIDQHVDGSMLGRTTINIEFSSYSTPDVGCNTHSGVTVTGRPEDADCLSRYGAQGLIGNIAQHSKAKNASVILEHREDELFLRVNDDGQGFDVSKITDIEDSGRGRGVFSMRERIGLLGGTASIESKLGQGTTAWARVPIGQSDEDA